MMFINKSVTSKEEILNVLRKMVSEQGIGSISMRSVAAECNVALGSLYNYFPSKEALLTETIGSVWQDIFHMEQCSDSPLPFAEYVASIYQRMMEGTNEYPHFFTAHSLSFTSSKKNQARSVMDETLKHMTNGMKQSLDRDPSVRADAFGSSLSESDFLDFVLSTLVSDLLAQKKDCQVLIEIIRRTIY
ncbi:MAG: TetR/AcrR family transcriptional regulator [Solobacterium sp.]|jgi:AcrR family transcriptional regulator|nr:TetR/AcrR family transcriptional regulator [Solobacterium sp.]MCH4265096.1 TetR/AcrR family transcriptional regulator [Solobacterium sp.]